MPSKPTNPRVMWAVFSADEMPVAFGLRRKDAIETYNQLFSSRRY